MVSSYLPELLGPLRSHRGDAPRPLGEPARPVAEWTEHR